MKIQLLIGIRDEDYVEHLSQVLLERYSDLFEVSVCSSEERLGELSGRTSFEVALLSPSMAQQARLEGIRLPLLLWDGATPVEGALEQLHRVRQYQRISALVGTILEEYAQVSGGGRREGENRARITAVWGPAGGTGKTTVALAYGARLAAEGRRVVYLNLEHFSSVPACFPMGGKSISTAFEKLDSDLGLLMQSIRQQDGASGLSYFCCPDNYDDMNLLTPQDLKRLAEACGQGVDEVVLDLPAVCDQRVRELLDCAGQIYVVLDGSRIGWSKWKQFRDQNNVYGQLLPKLVLVANKGCRPEEVRGERTVSLPYVKSDDPVTVYKTLSASSSFQA